MSRALLCLGSGVLLLRFLLEPEEVAAAVSAALALCADSVIPAMFPVLVMASVLISLGSGDLLSPLFAGVTERLFRLPGTAGSALLLGLVGGYPVGARTAADLYRRGQLSYADTCRLLTFCNNANPAFFISVLGAGVFSDTGTGFRLWLIHVLSALLTGILTGRNSSIRPSPAPAARPIPSFASAWVQAVGDSLRAILSVCAFVVIFRVLTRPLTALPGLWAPAAVGCTELFSLLPLLTPDSAGFLLAAGCSGWGGLSVLCQTAALLEGTDLPLAPCIRGKLLQGLLSLLLAGLLITAGGLCP